MGYTIVYSRQFLKTPDNRYIPMALYGSNNCTELNFATGKEIRERSWNTFVYNDDMILGDFDAIMDRVRKLHNRDAGQCFKFRSKWMEDPDVIKFFENGLNKAATLECLRMQDKSIFLHAYLSVWNADGNEWETRKMDVFIHSSEELIAWVEAAKIRKAEILMQQPKANIYLHMSFGGIEPLRAVYLDETKPVIAKNGSYYVSKIFPNGGYEADRDLQKAIVFENLEAAVQQLTAWNPALRFVQAGKPGANRTAKKPRNFVIQVERYGMPAYIAKLTAHRLYTVNTQEHAKRFASEKEAAKWFDEKINTRFSGISLSQCVQIN